jgi:predicted SprT family Zn-dependent metalloprotease
MTLEKPEEIRECIQKYIRKVGVDPIARRVFFSWGRQGMIRTLAYAKWPECEIVLSPILWPLLRPDEREETIAHEVAHLGDFLFCFNRDDEQERAHGPSWKAMMARAGYPNSTACHILAPHVVRAAYSNSRNHIPVSCSCRTHYITFARALKLTHGECSMRCKYCDEHIIISSFIDGETVVFGKGKP